MMFMIFILSFNKKHSLDGIKNLVLFQIMRDTESGNSKGFAFINFANFDASDSAIESMNGQYLCNRAISISYAFKKDSKGERHGTPAGKFLLHSSLHHSIYCNDFSFITPYIVMISLMPEYYASTSYNNQQLALLSLCYNTISFL